MAASPDQDNWMYGGSSYGVWHPQVPQQPIDDNAKKRNLKNWNQSAVPKSKLKESNAKRARVERECSKSRLQREPSCCGDSFWLPVFKPPDREQLPTSRVHLQGQWSQKTMSVTSIKPKKEKGVGFHMSVTPLRSATPCPPPCHCPACCFVERTTLVAAKKDMLPDRLGLVQHGVDSFTIYDKTKPWVRRDVECCTNPRPFARRMPDMLPNHDSSTKVVYQRKMMLPGKVIKDVRQMNKPRDRNTNRPREQNDCPQLCPQSWKLTKLNKNCI